MHFDIQRTDISNVFVITPDVFVDHRGQFMEIFREPVLEKVGVGPFVQMNLTVSNKGVIRGLHYQSTPPMGKLMWALSGKALLVAVDLRPDSSTLHQYITVESTPENRKQLWAPGPFARGICALEDDTIVTYLCTANFNEAGDKAIRWNDKKVNIPWPVTNPILSKKDMEAPTL